MIKNALNQNKKIFFLLIFLCSFVASFAQTTTFYDFNTPGDLTTYFTRGNTGTTQINQSLNTGIGGTGAVFIGNQSANEVYTTKQGYSNGGVGSVYEFSTFIKSEFNSGYSAIGFTSLPNQPHANSGNPAICLGVSVHGGGFIFYNNSTASYGNWQSGGIVNASMFDLLNNGSTDKWYKIILKITAQTNNNYHLQLEVWPSNSNGVLLHSTASAIHTRTYQNNNIGNSTVLYSYFGFGGYRVSNFDNYALNLQGSTVIDAGAPVVVNGTAVLSPILNNSIDIEGNVTDDRGISVTEKGFVWNTSGSPTVSDSKVVYGSGLGSFNGTINNLAPGTYYLRAYAINANGISYGTERIVIVPTQEGEIFTNTSNLEFNLCPDSIELVKTFTVSATGIGSNVSLSAVNGFSYSLDNNNFSSTLTINSVSGQVNTTTVHVKFINNNSTSNGILTLSATNALGRSIGLNASVLSTSINSQPTVTNETVCINTTPQTISITANDATAFQWYQNSSNTTTGATIINGATSTNYALPTNNPGTVYYFASVSFADCASLNSNIISQTVTPTLGSISSISGIANLASNATTATYSVSPVSGATSYIWNVPAGMTLTSQTGPSISVALSASFTNGTVSVYALNNCGVTQTRTFYATKLTGGIDFSVTGAPVLCANATETYTATTIADGIYNWTVPIGATIVSGQGTNSISVTTGANFTSGNIKAICVTSQYNYESNYAVAGVALPSFISGPSNVCGLSTTTYSVENVSGITYVWTLPSGMTVVGADNTASINVSISGTINGSITVQAQNNCGLSAPRRFTVNSAPLVGGINGANRVCGAVQVALDNQGNITGNTALNSYIYSVAAVSDADSYTWTVPTGATLVSGQGTTSITVSYNLATFESGTISVQAVNSTCGAGPERNLTVSTVTGTISGPTSLCGLTTATYSVPEDLGSGFIWTLPEGMSITTGAGTSSITVTITGPVYSNASLNVQFTTACGGTKTLSLGVSCSDYTNLAEQSCGAILSGTTSKIYALQRTGATAYEFEVTYDGTVYTTVVSNTSFFRLSDVSGLPLVFGGEYSIRVRIHRNEITSIYGTSCIVNTLSIPVTTLHAISCGATLSATTSNIYAASVVGASGYEFEVTYNGDVYTAVLSNDSKYRLSEVFGLPLVFGGQYSIRVKIYSNGQSGSYGDPCIVYTPSIPTTTLHATSCGATLSETTSNIYAAGVAGAGAYEFEVTYNGTVYTTVISNDSKFRLSEVDGLPLELGGQYTVRVRIHSNGQPGSYGTSCSVYTHSIPNAKIILCGTTITYNDVVYANEIANATAYKFNIYDATATTLLATMENAYNYFDFTQMSYSFNTTYQVTVTIKIGTQYGEESSNCSITIGPDPSAIAKQAAASENTKSSVVSLMTAYPNPFTTSFTISPLEGETDNLSYQVYDATGKIIESNSLKANELSSLEIGNYYPTGMYLVIVRQGATKQTFKMIKQ